MAWSQYEENQAERRSPAIVSQDGVRRLVKTTISIVLLFLIPAITTAKYDEDKDLIETFNDHVDSAYLANVYPRLRGDDMENASKSLVLSARIWGYALGQQLKYVKKDTPQHKKWVFLDKTYLSAIEDKVESTGRKYSISASEMERTKQKIRSQYLAALQGRFDDQMYALTDVMPGEAPNFFATLEESDAIPTIESVSGTWTDYSVAPNGYTSLIFDRHLSLTAGGPGFQFDPYTSTDMRYWNLVNGELVIYRVDQTVFCRMKMISADLWEGLVYEKNGVDIYVHPSAGSGFKRRFSR